MSLFRALFRIHAARVQPYCEGILSIVRNLERVPDHATDIAEEVLFFT
jgi:phosphate uptake regulator